MRGIEPAAPASWVLLFFCMTFIPASLTFLYHKSAKLLENKAFQ